jgi:hypothetical protein
VVSAVERTRAARAAPLVALAFFLGPLAAAASALFAVATPSNQHQLALHRYLTEHTSKATGTFAMEGIGLFRPSVFHFWMPFLIRPRYVAGEWSYERELRERPASLVIRNYRVPGWLTPEDRAFLAGHYVELNSSFLLPGARLSDAGERRVELLVSGVYDVHASGSCRLDGTDTGSAGSRELQAGPHDLSANAPCEVRLHVDPAGRDLLEMPSPVPYLVGPDFLLR